MSGGGARMRRLATFGGVGIVATLTHVAVGLSLVGAGLLAPFGANIVAFLTAFLVSYFGHKTWSFRSNAGHMRAAPRFFAVAVLGLILNQVIVYGIVDLLGLSYALALAVIIASVPVIVYALSSLWAFREDA